MLRPSLRKRHQELERRLHEVEQSLARLELALANTSPASEVDRLNKAFEHLADLHGALANTAPASEVERLNHAFELLTDLQDALTRMAPTGEINPVDRALQELADLQHAVANTAPSSEISRLDGAYSLIADLFPMVSERAVEIPWALSKYSGESSVLDVGYAFAEKSYLRGLLQLEIPFLVGVDAAESTHPKELRQFHEVRADVLRPCIRDESFELVYCISTIEHIGRDNNVYGLLDAEHQDLTDPDLVAIEVIGGWVVPGGRLLVTVPYGLYEDLGWQINYDAARLEELISASGLTTTERRFFGWLPGGWQEVSADSLSMRGY